MIGVTLQLYDHGAATGRKGACCAGQDIHDARGVADHLGIPHYVIDAEARFRDAVIAPFADSYAAGETPVPCIACNQSVKFGDLLDLARDLGAEAMATGHYVRRIEGEDGPELHRATDATRDQSWFLFATTRAQLARSLFPLGAMADKDAVRAEADRHGASGRAQARQPGYLLRAVRLLCRCGGQAAPRRRRARRDRGPARRGARPSRRHRALHDRPVEAPRQRRDARQRTPGRDRARSPTRAASSSARAAPAAARCICAT